VKGFKAPSVEVRNAHIDGIAQRLQARLEINFVLLHQSQAFAQDFAGVLVIASGNPLVNQLTLVRGNHNISGGHGVSPGWALADYANVAWDLLSWLVANCKASRFIPSEVTVSTNLEALEAEVLQLAPADRTRLFELLIASIDTDHELEQAWAREADRREAELESGAVVPVPGPQAVDRLRARLAQ
jgi:hypothetical protein